MVIDMNYINKIQNEIFSKELQNEKNHYIAQEMLRVLFIEEKDPINRKEIIKIFNDITHYIQNDISC